MEIKIGTVFNTPAETGCVATTAPGFEGAAGEFLATAPDGVVCVYRTVMVCGYGDPDHQRVPHECIPYVPNEGNDPVRLSLVRERETLAGAVRAGLGDGVTAPMRRRIGRLEARLRDGVS